MRLGMYSLTKREPTVHTYVSGEAVMEALDSWDPAPVFSVKGAIHSYSRRLHWLRTCLKGERHRRG